MDSQRLLERFLRYVRIDTTARPEADDYPSSPGQIELGRLLVDELQALRRRRRPARRPRHRSSNNTSNHQWLPPRRRPLRPSGHLAGDQRQGGQAAGDPQLPRGRPRPARRPRPRDSPDGQPRVERPAGANPDYQRRHDAAGGRRQGGRGHHHGNGRLARPASADSPRTAAALFHLRRGDRPRRRPPRSGPDRRPWPVTRSTARGAI